MVYYRSSFLVTTKPLFKKEIDFEMEAIRREDFNGPQNGLKMVKHPSLCQETIYTF